MKHIIKTPKQYIEQLPDDRKKVIKELRRVITQNLPKGFMETMSYGMIGYVVPHKLYPNGYHCDPKQPLPFMGIASQKNYITLYHMGMYANEQLLQWFTREFPKHSSTKLDMGKGCIRFKKPETHSLSTHRRIGKKMSVDEWIEVYVTGVKR